MRQRKMRRDPRHLSRVQKKHITHQRLLTGNAESHLRSN
jgi:hypothetical protein